MAVRIRLKRMGRLHRAYFRICAMDAHTPRDGKAIEELGTYDPMIRDTDKRCSIKAERVDYWLSVGALPTRKVKVLLDKYKGKVPEIRTDKRKVPVIPEVAPRKREKKQPPPQQVEAPAAPAEAAAPAAEAAPPAET